MVDLVTEIDPTEITEGTIDGIGVFDQLMKAANIHIEREHKRNRITGSDYSKVYLGQLQTCLDQSIKFLLARDSNLLIQKQLEIADKENLIKEQELITKQKQNDILDRDILLQDKELLLRNEQISLATQEVLVAQEQVQKIKSEWESTVLENNNIHKKGALIDAQALEVKASEDLKVQQERNLIAENLNLTTEGLVLIEQRGKIAAEAALLGQKQNTEKAQTEGTAAYNSTVYWQNQVLSEQAEGFKKDAKIRAGKALIDAWSIEGSAGGSFNNAIQEADIRDAVNTMITGTS